MKYRPITGDCKNIVSCQQLIRIRHLCFGVSKRVSDSASKWDFSVKEIKPDRKSCAKKGGNNLSIPPLILNCRRKYKNGETPALKIRSSLDIELIIMQARIFRVTDYMKCTSYVLDRQTDKRRKRNKSVEFWYSEAGFKNVSVLSGRGIYFSGNNNSRHSNGVAIIESQEITKFEIEFSTSQRQHYHCDD